MAKTNERKTKMARIIRATGAIEEVAPRNERNFELGELQKVVGGYIEIVKTKTGEIMVVNEDGHSLALPFEFRMHSEMCVLLQSRALHLVFRPAALRGSC